MGDSAMTRLGDRLRARRHSALLVSLIVAFAVRPILGDERLVLALFSIALMILLMVALSALQLDAAEEAGARRREAWRWVLVGWLLGAVAVAERLLALLAASEGIPIVAAVSWLLALAFVTWRLLRGVLRHRTVTGETISMAISIYLLLALTWGLLYLVLDLRHPGAFQIAGQTTPMATTHNLPIFTYFSLAALSTNSFGDVTPLSMQVRYAAAAEGVVGQFYLAILVARLVALQMSQAAGRSR